MAVQAKVEQKRDADVDIRIKYIWVDSDTSVPLKVYDMTVPQMADIIMLKHSVAAKHKVPKKELFVCDIWRSNIHHELRRKDLVSDIDEKQDEIFIYHSKRPNSNDFRHKNPIDNPFDFQTFVVNHQHRIWVQDGQHGQRRYEDEGIGYPLLLTLPMKHTVTMTEIKRQLWDLVMPFCTDKNIKIDLTSDKLPFSFWAAWDYDHHLRIDDSDTVFDLTQRNLIFIIHWTEYEKFKYNSVSWKVLHNIEEQKTVLDQARL